MTDPHDPFLARASPAYREALFACRRHHAVSKTFSGMFLRPHAVAILGIIRRLGCRTVLDYGCGKGRQYAWRSHADSCGVPRGLSLEEFWGVPVVKYDPAWPAFATEPVGTFDLVLCTHTLGSVPLEDLPWVLDRLYDLSRRAVYVAEKIGCPGKRVLPVPGAHPVFTQDQWGAALRRPGMADLEVWLATRERLARGDVLADTIRVLW